ncbi:MAG TPA: nuclear transport factor 2 family protein [Rhizomicrobium sp.]|nr:nuclear transport factor 2 family protein [Rhizomicrobium sp.]
MKKIFLAIAASGMLGCGAAQAEDAAMAPVHQFIDSLNAGNVEDAAATHLPRTPIIDEFAPYHWNSFDAWFKAFVANNKKFNVTDVRVTLSAPTTGTTDEKFAYEVIPNVIDAKMDGKPMTEKGIFAFALVKNAQGWRIASWAGSKQ